ncbi:WD40-repeat-containing domain protein [Entophlyctis helioformis]|nr:WD40-repeat-containing domain protein [Entophlyctis helioformis]
MHLQAIGSTGDAFWPTRTAPVRPSHSLLSEPNYFKSLSWSPDGQCILTNSNDNALRLFDTRVALQTLASHDASSAGNADASETGPMQTSLDGDRHSGDGSSSMPVPVDLAESLKIHLAEPTYDLAWYPFMNSADPATCCFVSSSRDHPVQLWDAYTGQLRGSYITKDHVDQVAAPMAVAFSPDGSEVFCGFEGKIQIFSTSRPGTDCVSLSLTPSRKSRDGLKGLISDIAFGPDSAAANNIFAVASYSGSVGLYDSVSHSPIHVFCPSRLTRHGVTQVQLVPTTATTLLLTASRQSIGIECWDLRMMGRHCLGVFARDAQTQQRLAFDVSTMLVSGAMHLVTGDRFGNMLAYDMLQSLSADDAETRSRGDTSPYGDHALGRLFSMAGQASQTLRGGATAASTMESIGPQTTVATQPMLMDRVANAAVSSAKVHPFLPCVAVALGERWSTWHSCHDHHQANETDEEDAERGVGARPAGPDQGTVDCRLSILEWVQRDSR